MMIIAGRFISGFWSKRVYSLEITATASGTFGDAYFVCQWTAATGGIHVGVMLFSPAVQTDKHLRIAHLRSNHQQRDKKYKHIPT